MSPINSKGLGSLLLLRSRTLFPEQTEPQERSAIYLFLAVRHPHKHPLKKYSVSPWLRWQGRLMNSLSVCSGYPTGLRSQL